MQAITIVLVEDDPAHAKLIERNLRRSGINNPLEVFSNGQKALDFFFAQGEHKNRSKQTPLLALLDLNMPGINGIQVLEKLKENPETHQIPVIVLTTTDDQNEIDHCYELGCNAYITKPVEYNDFCKVIRELGMFIEILAVPHS